MSKINPGITQRQAAILAAIVREYANSSQPIGSEELCDKYKFGFSSATIRNEMSALEEMGYIEQPHTSAGRVPTDKGFRYFVNELMRRFELSLKEQRQLREHLERLQEQNQEIGRSIAKLLAQKSEQAAFALLPEETSASGLANIFQNPDLDRQGMAEVAEFFEDIDEYADKMLSKMLKETPEALIGKETQLAPLKNYSLIVSRVNLPSGKQGVIGIIGPKAMRYDKNISLVEYVAKFLSGGALLLLIFLVR
ncbi:hypothetical protein KGQ24_00010 [Patescibacteria group bacterium]|nr:hypothetical protein [Patescibacteria group bacterium]